MTDTPRFMTVPPWWARCLRWLFACLLVGGVIWSLAAQQIDRADRRKQINQTICELIAAIPGEPTPQAITFIHDLERRRGCPFTTPTPILKGP